jgi:hypothetical protein
MSAPRTDASAAAAAAAAAADAPTAAGAAPMVAAAAAASGGLLGVARMGSGDGRGPMLSPTRQSPTGQPPTGQPSTGPASAQCAADLAAVMSRLDITSMEELCLLASSGPGLAMIEQEILHMAFPTGRQAKVYMALTQIRSTPQPDSATVQLAAQFAKDADRRLHPWMETWQLVADAAAASAGVSKAQLQAVMAESARQRTLTVEDASFLHVLLFFTPEEQLRFAASILAYSGMQRLQIFNWIVANMPPPSGSSSPAPDVFVRTRGQQILELRAPLWPRDDRFSGPTLQLFTANPISGGGPTTNTSAFRASALFDPNSRTFGDTSPPRAKVAGAGSIPVVGHADTASIEAFILPWMKKMETLVAKANASSTNRPSPTPDAAQQAPTPNSRRQAWRTRGGGDGPASPQGE